MIHDWLKVGRGHYWFWAIGGGLVLIIGIVCIVASASDGFREPITGFLGAFIALTGAAISLLGATGLKRR